MADLVELDGRALHELAETVALIEPGQWRLSTPCDLWTVRDLLEHIVAVNRKYERIPGGDPWLPGVEDVDLGDDPARAYRDTIRPFLDAWRRPGVLETPTRTQAGQEVPAELALRAHLRETLVHGWDLAVSIGRSAPFDDAVVQAYLQGVVQACLQGVAQVPAIRPDGVGYADAIPVDEDAPPIVRLAAFYGRDVSTWS